MKKMAYTLCILFGTCTTAICQDTGKHWENMDLAGKSAYISGFTEGSAYVCGYQSALNKTNKQNTKQPSICIRLNGATVGQIIQKVDNIYSNKLNTKLLLADVTNCALAQLNGEQCNLEFLREFIK